MRAMMRDVHGNHSHGDLFACAAWNGSYLDNAITHLRGRLMERGVDEPGRPANERCMQCGGIDTVVVSTFRWHEALHLSWRCTRCRRMWVTPERRKTTRRPKD
jgi:hypothetical protein